MDNINKLLTQYKQILQSQDDFYSQGLVSREEYLRGRQETVWDLIQALMEAKNKISIELYTKNLSEALYGTSDGK